MNPIPQGYKQTEIGVIPEDWGVTNIGSLITDMRGGAPLKPSDFSKAGVKVLPKGGVSFGGVLKIKENEQQFCSEAYANKHSMNCIHELYTIVVLRDLVPSGPSIGLMVKINENENFLLAQGVYGFLARSKSIANYLIHYSNSSTYRKLANGAMVGSTQVHITNDAFKSIKVALPPQPEQTAIATALSDVDALITGLESLIAKKQAIKTATMQQLLTGKTRLPQFAHHPDGTPKGTQQTELGEIPEDWGVTELGSVIEKFVGGGTPSRLNKQYWGNEIPWVTVKDFATFSPFMAQESITKLGLSNSSANLIPKGTLITSTRMALGKAVIYQVDVTINQDLKALFCREMLSTKYLYFWFESNARRIDELGSGSTVKGLSLTDLRKQAFLLPSNEEQSAIAQILSDMDEEIQTLQTRLSKTQQIKQGMMQQLLTGKVRLIKPSKEVIHE